MNALSVLNLILFSSREKTPTFWNRKTNVVTKIEIRRRKAMWLRDMTVSTIQKQISFSESAVLENHRAQSRNIRGLSLIVISFLTGLNCGLCQCEKVDVAAAGEK